MTVTATFLTATTGTDEYNNPVQNWDDPAETTVPGCWFEPTTRSEGSDGGESAQTRGTLYTPPGLTATHTQRVRIDAGPGTGTWSIYGKPKDWGLGLEIALAEVEGTEVG